MHVLINKQPSPTKLSAYLHGMEIDHNVNTSLNNLFQDRSLKETKINQTILIICFHITNSNTFFFRENNTNTLLYGMGQIWTAHFLISHLFTNKRKDIGVHNLSMCIP